jgi:hypothetical protein
MNTDNAEDVKTNFNDDKNISSEASNYTEGFL